MNIESVHEFFKKVTEVLNIIFEIFKEAWKQPHAPEILTVCAGLIIVLILWRKISNYYRPIKLFNNRVGEVEVSRKALDELVQSVCYSLGALNRPDVKIYTKRGRLCMTVSLKLESGQKLTDATGEIQTALTSAFREHMGIEKLGKIDVRVLGFKGLVYKPTNKFLPPIKDEADNIIDESNPVIDIVDNPTKQA